MSAAVEIVGTPGRVMVRVREVTVWLVEDKHGAIRLAPPSWATRIHDMAQLEDVYGVLAEVARRMREGLDPETGKERPE